MAAERTLRLEFHDGATENLSESWHPLFQSPFVQDLMEMSDKQEERRNQVEVPLPSFIDRDTMISFYNFLWNCFAGRHVKMEFGRHANLTFQAVTANHRDYYYCGKAQVDPSGPLQRFLEWADESYLRGAKPENKEDVARFLPIAKFFQIDMCAQCGCLGKSTDPDNGKELTPCRRSAWPKIPVIPDWETVTKNSKEKGKLKDWKEAWKRADQEREKVPCSSDDMLCRDCGLRNGCQICGEYECESCQADSATPKTFQEWHEGTPLPEYEDEYGRRGQCPFKTFGLSPCLHCGRRVCLYCGTQCQDCQRKACDRCKEDLNTWCEGCRITIENNDDFDIGPIDRDEYVCRPCFQRRPHFFGCGEPSFDPEAEPSVDEEDPEEEPPSEEEEEEEP